MVSRMLGADWWLVVAVVGAIGVVGLAGFACWVVRVAWDAAGILEETRQR